MGTEYKLYGKVVTKDEWLAAVEDIGGFTEVRWMTKEELEEMYPSKDRK